MNILLTMFATAMAVLLVSSLINGSDGDADDFSEIITLVLAGIAITSLFAIIIIKIYTFLGGI